MAHEKPSRPWWAPDAKGALAFAIVAICSVTVMIRMFHPSQQDDKVLDMMITILFSTCLVTIINFNFGSSSGSQAKDESQTKMVEKLTTAPLADPKAIAAAAAVAAVAAAPAAASRAAQPAADIAAPPAAEAAAPAAAEKAVADALAKVPDGVIASTEADPAAGKATPGAPS